MQKIKTVISFAMLIGVLPPSLLANDQTIEAEEACALAANEEFSAVLFKEEGEVDVDRSTIRTIETRERLSTHYSFDINRDDFFSKVQAYCGEKNTDCQECLSLFLNKVYERALEKRMTAAHNSSVDRDKKIRKAPKKALRDAYNSVKDIECENPGTCSCNDFRAKLHSISN